jgi:membrane protein YqaA with SNARE-associated domain
MLAKDIMTTFPHDVSRLAGACARPLKPHGIALWTILEGAASARVYPFVVGVIACLLTVSMTVPFVSILIGAVLVNRERWVAIVIVSSFGSAFGGVFLYLGIHHLGWAEVLALYPQLAQSETWSTMTRWISDYGVWALLLVAASPLPQTPALAITAVSRVPVIEIFAAMLCGKLLKYTFYGYLAANVPNWLRRTPRR